MNHKRCCATPGYIALGKLSEVVNSLHHPRPKCHWHHHDDELQNQSMQSDMLTHPQSVGRNHNSNMTNWMVYYSNHIDTASCVCVCVW